LSIGGLIENLAIRYNSNTSFYDLSKMNPVLRAALILQESSLWVLNGLYKIFAI
jgi:hypothetical protein